MCSKQLAPHVLLIVMVSSCVTGPARPTVPADWQDIPIMPNAVQSTELPEVTAYHYAVGADTKTVERFYLDRLKASGWELLGKGDASAHDMKSIDLWFSRGQEIRTIQIWEQDGITHVAIIREQ